MGDFKVNKAGMAKLERELQKKLKNVPVELEGSEDDAARKVQKELKKRGLAADRADALKLVRETRGKAQ